MYWNPDDIIKAVVGGVLIALASSFNLLMKGRISGTSGIIFGILTNSTPLWRWSFVLGLLLSSSYTFNFIDKLNFFETSEKFLGDLSFGGFIFGGFLVGFGTKLGNGCTSGHGVCGMPRLSIRSWVAAGTFLALGIVSAVIKFHAPYLNSGDFS
jgi:uncharacterized membrane protein YedE/YeeE